MTALVSIERITTASPNRLIEQCAEVHQDQIRQGFLTTLGPRFLQLLYRKTARSGNSFLFTAISEQEVVGFACGITSMKGFYRQFIFPHGLLIFPLILPRLLSWNRVRSVLELLRYPSKADAKVELPQTQLLNLCVSNPSHRDAIGSLLLAAVAKEFDCRDVPDFRVVVGQTRSEILRLCEAVGGQQVGETQVHKGAQSYIYVLDVEEVIRSDSREPAKPPPAPPVLP